MWKKDEEKAEKAEGRSGTSRKRSGGGSAGSASSGPGAGTATIGSSIRINGEVTGDEALVIQGFVDGSVTLKQHEVTVGPDGEVEADIDARVITVDGKVRGDLTADEQIVLRSSASVEGDLSAPRVVLEDGAHFRGGVQMEERSTSGKRGDGGSSTTASSSLESKGSGGGAKTGGKASGDGKSTAGSKAETATSK